MTKPTWTANKGVLTRDGSEAFEDAFLIVWQVVEVPAVPGNRRRRKQLTQCSSVKQSHCLLPCLYTHILTH